MVEIIVALAVGSRCAKGVRLAILVRTRSASIAPDERLGLGELDGVIRIREWDIDEIKAACILVA
jgi:hypothetical protein